LVFLGVIVKFGHIRIGAHDHRHSIHHALRSNVPGYQAIRLHRLGLEQAYVDCRVAAAWGQHRVNDFDAGTREPILGAWQLGIHGGRGFGKRPAHGCEQGFDRTPNFVKQRLLVEFLEAMRSFFHQPKRTVWVQCDFGEIIARLREQLGADGRVGVL